jgi:hypothetical protein
VSCTVGLRSLRFSISVKLPLLLAAYIGLYYMTDHKAEVSLKSIVFTGSMGMYVHSGAFGITSDNALLCGM